MNNAQQPTWYTPAPQKPKSGKGKKIAVWAGGIFAVLVVGSAISGGSDETKPAATPAPVATSVAKPAAPKPSPKPTKHKTTYATFKVWGTAPAGALGPLDITYGSDTDMIDGKFKGGKFEATLPVKKDKLYYNVSAQLQGSGDIHCSVTVDGKTQSGRAMGGYNICSVQLSHLFGEWS